MTAIARDEAAHAQLAWDVHAWATDKLDARGNAAVAEARAEAVTQLVSSAGAQAGLPAHPHGALAVGASGGQALELDHAFGAKAPASAQVCPSHREDDPRHVGWWRPQI
jgi:hypothetical protein